MRILLGISGGLDSAYAALKLKNEGNDVEGAVLCMHSYTEIDAAKEAAEGIGIPLNVIDCRESFENIVVKNFISEYMNARTPNPCTICNSEVKFKFLYDYAMAHGFDFIATGHYAKIAEIDTDRGKRYAVKKGKDSKKDQSYMLWRLPQEILAKLIFPLCDEEKQKVRDSAREAELSVAERPESQEICFVPSGDYAAFIEERGFDSSPGDFIDDNGNILGRHNGIIRYTIGQRKGLGVSYGKRIFVTNINPENNSITLSPEDKYSDKFSISGMVFSGACEPKINQKFVFDVKIRYAAPPVKAVLTYLGEGRGTVKMEQPMRAVTPGQSAVFYDNDLLMCGGYID